EERAVERHLEGCSACRALVADLRTVRAAAFTLDRLEPPAHLLARIQERIAAEPPQRARRLAWPNTRGAWATWLAAAAALVLTTAIGVAPLLNGRDPEPAAPNAAGPGGLVDSV